MITVISYPNNEINYSIDDGEYLEDTLSASYVQNLWINLNETTLDEFVEISYNGEVITLLITDECRYEPMDIAFQNRYGGLQFLTFFKAKTESLSVKSEEFETDRGQPRFGNHQFVTYNVQGSTKFKMNSGFVDESMNETFKQLFLSERVWSFKNNLYTPLKLGSKSMEYKTRQKDRLINYEVEFEYAFNEINNI